MGKFSLPEGIELMEDITQARWIEELLRPWGAAGVPLGALLPNDFAAYARVFHPASILGESQDEDQPVRWATIASWTGATVHPLMQFGNISNLPFPYQPTWGDAPYEGCLPGAECRTLVDLLREFTATPDGCYLCLWEGYGLSVPLLRRGRPSRIRPAGWLRHLRDSFRSPVDTDHYPNIPRVSVPNRKYLLFRGSLDAVPSFKNSTVWHQSPNLWWSEDRAWCVATEIDLYDTYIGGSKDCIERVLQCPDLEALPVPIEARVDAGADVINT